MIYITQLGSYYHIMYLAMSKRKRHRCVPRRINFHNEYYIIRYYGLLLNNSIRFVRLNFNFFFFNIIIHALKTFNFISNVFI